MTFKHYSHSLCSPMAAVANPWRNAVDRDTIRLDASCFFITAPAITGSLFSCYFRDILTHKNSRPRVHTGSYPSLSSHPVYILRNYPSPSLHQVCNLGCDDVSKSFACMPPENKPYV